MKKFLLSLMSLMMTLVAMAGEPTSVATFTMTDQESVSAYSCQWTGKDANGEVWTFTNFNNNKNGWTYIKCGWKTAATTSTITTPVIGAAVTTYVLTVDKTSNVTGAKLEVLNTDSAVVETKDVTLAAGDVVVSLTGKANSIYRLTIENEKTSSNGTTQISKIALYEAGQYVADEPIANTPETAYTVAEARKLIDAGKSLADVVYVKGIVSQVDEYYDNQYITYWISDDGTTTDQMECYDGLSFDGAAFADSAAIEVGATVVVKGTLSYYASKSIYELNKGNILYSYTAPAGATPSVKDIVLTVAEGETIDPSDGTFKTTLTYTTTGLDDHFLAYGTINYTVTPKDGEPVTGSTDFDVTAGSRNIFLSGLSYSTEYTLTINSISVDELDMETWENVNLVNITEGLPSVTFTTNAEPASVKDIVLTVAEGETIDPSDGTFKTTLTYTTTGLDDHFLAYGTINYTVTPKDGEPVTGSTDFDVTAGARNIYLSGLSYSTEYTLTINSISVDELDMDTFEESNLVKITEGLPSVTFNTGEDTAVESVNANPTATDGKFLENGKIIIRKAGKKYNVNGAAAK